MKRSSAALIALGITVGTPASWAGAELFTANLEASAVVRMLEEPEDYLDDARLRMTAELEENESFREEVMPKLTVDWDLEHISIHDSMRAVYAKSPFSGLYYSLPSVRKAFELAKTKDEELIEHNKMRTEFMGFLTTTQACDLTEALRSGEEVDPLNFGRVLGGPKENFPVYLEHCGGQEALAFEDELGTLSEQYAAKNAERKAEIDKLLEESKGLNDL